MATRATMKTMIKVLAKLGLISNMLSHRCD
jgi:hypothetical protein